MERIFNFNPKKFKLAFRVPNNSGSVSQRVCRDAQVYRKIFKVASKSQIVKESMQNRYLFINIASFYTKKTK